MYTMDQHLAELVKQGTITYEVGVEKCHHVEDFNKLVGGLRARTRRCCVDAGARWQLRRDEAGNGMH